MKLPPLRERTDLAVVIDKMLEQESVASCNGRSLSVSQEVTALFEQCAWPGNFRQLGNLLRTAAAMVDDDGVIRREHLPDDFFEDLAGREASATAQVGQPAPVALRNDARLQEVALSVIAAAIERHGGNVSAAARALGVSRTTIYRKMPASFGLNRAVEDE